MTQQQEIGPDEVGPPPTVGPEEEISARVNFINPSNTPILFTNHLFVRRIKDQVILTFAQVELPYEINISEENKSRIQDEGLSAQVVAKLAITAESFGDMLKIMNGVYNRMNAKQLGEDDGAE